MRWLLLLIGLPLVSMLALFFLLTDASPSLQRTAQIGIADLERGKAIIDRLGLRRMRDGDMRKLVLTEADLDKGVNYLAHRFARGSASARIDAAQMIVRASLPLPVLPRFLNLELVLDSGAEVLQPVQLRLGMLTLPAGLSGALLQWFPAATPFRDDFAAARSLLDRASIRGRTLVMHFTWRGDAVKQVLTAGGGAGTDESTLRVYRERLASLGGADFAHLLGAMMAFAHTRADDPVAENRAALTVLAEYAMGSRLLSKQGITVSQRRTGVKLAGRNDFAQHFAISAFLAATGGEHLSNMTGLFKELKDAKGGSGFSFNDLAADRAGAYFGQFSTRSARSARQVQARLAQTRNAALFFPKVADLPEFIGEAEFRRRFGGVDKPGYRSMVRQIDARIEALPVYQD
jgi:hypothetical protein